MSSKLSFFLVLFVYSLFCRLLPYVLYHFGVSIDPATTWYPWNFAPLMAVSLFSGACASDRRWSFGLPLAVLVLSDFGIWAVTGHFDWAFPRSQPVIYACFAAAAGLGLLLRKRPNIMTSVPMAIAAETVFFLVTNFAVWYAGEGNTYAMTPTGLAACYAMGLPFFGRSLISTSLYTAALFSPAGLALAGHPAARSTRTSLVQA
ncbi:hypothetical protein GC163_00630 [bacterium]|nr:hypothetical protein [bacterium]